MLRTFLASASGGSSTYRSALLRLGTASLAAGLLLACTQEEPIDTLGQRAVEGSEDAQDAKLTPQGIVYGYLPYWTASGYAVPWERLTHLAYFNVDLAADGEVTDDHGWFDSSLAEAIRTQAKAHGVKLQISVTLFGDSDIGDLLLDPVARATALDNLRNLAVGGLADGVNIDFEMVPYEAKQEFVEFLSELKADLTADNPNAELSIAGPAVDWDGAYDFEGIAEVCDQVFIMAYGYHWSGSDPGPQCPARESAVWGEKSLQWSIDDYLTWGGPKMPAKLVAGLPLYGFDWQVEAAGIPADKAAKGKVLVQKQAESDAPTKGGWLWDQDSESSYYVYDDGNPHQVWVDTVEGVVAKFAVIADSQIGGVGFWALGYESKASTLWAEVENAFFALPREGSGGDAGANGQGADDGGPRRPPELEEDPLPSDGIQSEPNPEASGEAEHQARKDAGSKSGCALGSPISKDQNSAASLATSLLLLGVAATGRRRYSRTRR